MDRKTRRVAWILLIVGMGWVADVSWAEDMAAPMIQNNAGTIQESIPIAVAEQIAQTGGEILAPEQMVQVMVMNQSNPQPPPIITVMPEGESENLTITVIPDPFSIPISGNTCVQGPDQTLTPVFPETDPPPANEDAGPPPLPIAMPENPANVSTDPIDIGCTNGYEGDVIILPDVSDIG